MISAAKLKHVEATIADIERRIAEQNACIIADLLKGRDPSDAEDRVVEMRIALHRMKSPCGLDVAFDQRAKPGALGVADEFGFGRWGLIGRMHGH